MKSFSLSFEAKPPIKFGEGVSLETGKILKAAGCKKAMIITDAGLVKAGVVDPILKCIENEGLAVVVYDKVAPDPSVDSVHSTSKAVNEEKVDAIVSIGGGSSMDTAKAVALLTTNPPPVSTYFLGPHPPVSTKKKGCYLIHIATTAGTGAEVSGGAMIGDANGKQCLADINFKADLAIEDPTLTLGLPPYITATTAIDSMCHAIDGMMAPNCSIYSDMIDGMAAGLAWHGLQTVLKDPKNLEARGALSVAAGMPFLLDNVGWTHCTGHVFGSVYHLAHGHCVAIGLPFYLERAIPVKPHEAKVLAKALDFDPESPTLGQDFKAAFIKLFKDCGLKTPKELGWDIADFIALTPKIMAEPTYMMNMGDPSLPDEVGVRKMLTDMYDF